LNHKGVLTKMRILIADDDDLSLELLGNTLKQAGYKVKVASNGREALKILHTWPCRMVISDWSMPEVNGIDLCRDIRGGSFPHYIYFILLTSRSQVQDTVEGLSAGADDFIAKPFHPTELCMRIRAGERILSLETRELAIFALAKLAESRDWETGAHLERMRNYAYILAQDLMQQETYRDQVDSEFARLIYLTSPLHDIGKVGIPDSILLKPGRLSDREFNIMKRHTIIGAKTLTAALRQHPRARFLRMARDIALTHHEHFDGTGYPRRLGGRAIPLCGRIVTLADVYDALTTRRVYTEAFSHEVARSIICDGAGHQFDPDLVEAFLRNEEAFLSVRSRYAEGKRVQAGAASRSKKDAPSGKANRGRNKVFDRPVVQEVGSSLKA
jgi:putative two-component system response regulator